MTLSQEVINVGSETNDPDADPIRTAFTKVNANFDGLFGNVQIIPSSSSLIVGSWATTDVNDRTIVGYEAGDAGGDTVNSTLVGKRAGYANSAGNLTAFGRDAGRSNAGNLNTFVGG